MSTVFAPSSQPYFPYVLPSLAMANRSEMKANKGPTNANIDKEHTDPQSMRLCYFFCKYHESSKTISSTDQVYLSKKLIDEVTAKESRGRADPRLTSPAEEAAMQNHATTNRKSQKPKSPEKEK